MKNKSFKESWEAAKWSSTIGEFDQASYQVPPAEWSIDRIVEKASASLDALPKGLKMEIPEEKMGAVHQYLEDTRDYATQMYEHFTLPLTEAANEAIGEKTLLKGLFRMIKATKGRVKEAVEITKSTNQREYQTALVEYLMGDKPTYAPSLTELTE